MDKNTVIGMLLMCAVIFGFMYLQQPSKEELEAQRKAQAEQVSKQSEAAATAAQVDSLTAQQAAMLDSLVKQNNGIKNETMNLAFTDGHATGSIKVGNKSVDLASLAKADSNDPSTHNLAVQQVVQLLDKFNKNQAFASHLTGNEEIIKLKNDSLTVEISTKGAAVKKATLNAYKAYRTQEDYKTNKSVPVELVAQDNNSLSFILNTDSQRFDTSDFYFTPKQEGDSAVTMTMNLDGGATWSVRYALQKDINGRSAYMLRAQVTQSGMESIIPSNINEMDIVWRHKLRRQEAGKNFEERNSALYWKQQGDNGDVDNLSEAGNNDKELKENIKWFSAKSQFFSSVLIADRHFNGAKVASQAFEEGHKEYNNFLKDLTVTTRVSYNSRDAKPAAFNLYFGPNKYKVLSSYDSFSPQEDLHLTRLVSLGWTLFRWINTVLIIPVFDWLGTTGMSYGIIILILTILIKLVLSPLTFKSYLSQAKMKILQPDIKAINEKYPNPEDAMKKQQKTMELYSQAGASPFGGCLPMLLQMPILIAMFWFFPSSIELRGQSFLWAPDLSAPDAIISLPFSIPFLGNHLSIFCLLMTVTNIAYTYVSMQSQSSSQMPGMKWMMYLMPIMFLVFFNNYAAGLSYYYFVSLLITIIQTYISRMLVDEDKVRAKMAENAKNPKKKKKSGFMARLEEAQRQQQAALKEQQKRNAKKRR